MAGQALADARSLIVPTGRWAAGFVGSFSELPAVVSCWSNLTQNVFAQATAARMAAAILACLVLQPRSNAAALPAFHHAQRGPFGLRHALNR
jgi:hypothetical protein